MNLISWHNIDIYGDIGVCACSESDSGSSEDSVDASKSNHIGPDIKVEYSQTNAVDDWRTDLIPSPRYSSPHPPQSDYSELRYPRKVGLRQSSIDCLCGSGLHVLQ